MARFWVWSIQIQTKFEINLYQFPNKVWLKYLTDQSQIVVVNIHLTNCSIQMFLLSRKNIFCLYQQEIQHDFGMKIVEF